MRFVIAPVSQDQEPPGNPGRFTDPDRPGYTVGQAFLIAKGNTANATTTPTLQVGNLTAVTIVKRDGSPLAVGDLPAKATFWAEYDGTNLRYVGPTVSDIAAAVAAYASAFVVGAADGQCRLSLFNPTTSNGQTTSQTLQMLPFAGNALVNNGVPQGIPAGGVKLSYIVNNTLQPASTLLYVYAWMNAGVMTLEASTTGYTVDGFGRANKTGDATRRLVGIVYPTAQSLFRDDTTYRGVLSYFNRGTKRIDSGPLGPVVLAQYASGPMNNPMTFLTWGDEYVDIRCAAYYSQNTGTGYPFAALSNYIDGSSAGSMICNPASSSGSSQGYAIGWAEYPGFLAEGVHTCQAYLSGGYYGGGYSGEQIGIIRG